MLTAVVGYVVNLRDSNAHCCVDGGLVSLNERFGQVLYERIEQFGNKQVRGRRELPKLVGGHGASSAVRVRRAKHNFVISEGETLRASKSNCGGSGGTIHADDVA
jgi:hypothetical protein